MVDRTAAHPGSRGRGAAPPLGVPRWSCLLALCLALVGLVLPPSAGLAAQAPDAAEDEHDPPWSRLRGGRLVTATAHFDVRVGEDSPPIAQVQAVAAVAEAVVASVETRMNTPLAGRVTLLVLPADAAPEPCRPRAAALPGRRRIVLFAGPDTLEPRALHAFLAHELGHQLTLDRWGSMGGDRRLLEGLATWAAEPYWLAWRDWRSLDGAVAELRDARAFAPLAGQLEGCLVAAERDVYYSVWASFIDFLLRRYGWDRLGAALTLPQAAEDRADYVGAYGRTLEQLAAEWERELVR